MKKIHIFKPGTHTSAGGSTIEFSEDVLRAAVEAYDPDLHLAPIVVGHPRDNGPAYGWIGGLEYHEGDGIYAEPQELEEQFSELVKDGRFKKVSASFYAPDAPTNPKPGAYYLRHLGFLGAQPPAIKGLKPIEFSEAEEGVVEFGEFDIATTQGIFKRLREFLIDKFSRDEADKVIPDWALEDLDMAKRMAQDANAKPDPAPGFSEPNQNPEDPDMDLQKKLDDALAKIQQLENEHNNFSERETALKQKEAAIAKSEIKRTIQGMADEGKVLPADVDHLAEFASQLDNEQVVEFGEGDEAKTNRRDFFLAWLSKQPKRVDFNEHSDDDDDPEKPADPAQKAARITDFMEKQSAAGKPVTYDQALRAVNEGTDREK